MTHTPQRPELFPGVQITEGGLIPIDRSLPPVPLKHTSIRADTIGPVCAVEVEQQFHNTHTAAIEAVYVFPLPENAAVTDLSLVVGERVITSTVQEKEAAQRDYAAAAQAGHQAALLEQERPNIARISVANIQPDERVQVRLRFHDQLDYDDGGYTLVLPTVVMPRYTPDDHIDHTPPAAPLLPLGSREGHTIDIRVEIDAGKLDRVTSPSHEIDIQQQRGGRTIVRLRAADVLPNKDFVLRYRVASHEPTAAAWTYRPDGQPGTVLLTLTPQGIVAPDAIVPRDVLFVFDRSGSMSGTAIIQARNALRACLRALNDQDTFNIFPFDNKVEQFAAASQPFTQDSIDRADAYIAGIDARGGTEILGALTHALAHEADPERLRVVVFLTDGGVSNEDEVLRELRDRMGDARVFAFGIGSAVNRFLLDKLAQVGRGNAEYLLPGEEIEAAIQRFQRRAAVPLITDIRVDWGTARVTDMLPSPLPDLYAGQPLTVLARFHSVGTTAVRVSGRTHKGQFEQMLDMGLPAATPDRSPLWIALPQLWGRARVDHLLSESRHESRKTSPLRDEIISLGLAYRLLTPYTSFIAIEERRDAQHTGDKAQRILVPIHLPEGTQREAFESTAPFLATMAMHRFAAAPNRSSRTHKADAPRGGFGALLREGIGMLGGPRKGEASLSAAKTFAAAPVADGSGAGAAPTSLPAVRPISDTERALAALRFLARTQSVNGSWSDDGVATALALAAFLSGGHTPNAGDFRPQLARAVQWLATHHDYNGAAPLIAWTLAALAAMTDSPSHRDARDHALSALGTASDPIERAFTALAQQHAGGTHQTLPIDALPADSITSYAGVCATLLHAMAQTDAAQRTAQHLASLQSQSGTNSGAVVTQQAQPTDRYVLTALGALVWNGFANVRGMNDM